MKSNRKLLAGSILAAGAMLTTAAGISIATAADETPAAAPARPGRSLASPSWRLAYAVQA